MFSYLKTNINRLTIDFENYLIIILYFSASSEVDDEVGACPSAVPISDNHVHCAVELAVVLLGLHIKHLVYKIHLIIIQVQFSKQNLIKYWVFFKETTCLYF